MIKHYYVKDNHSLDLFKEWFNSYSDIDAECMCHYSSYSVYTTVDPLVEISADVDVHRLFLQYFKDSKTLCNVEVTTNRLETD